MIDVCLMRQPICRLFLVNDEGTGQKTRVLK